MLKISVKNISGQDVKELSLKESLFGVPKNDALVHQVYVAMMANQRQSIAHTKDRAERAGSGIKPWRQKGTGRARVGQVRNPIWRKGGVSFGPTKDRNFSKDTNAKMRQKATLVALSEKFRAGKLVVLDGFTYPEKKTRLFVETLQHLDMNQKSFLLGLTGAEAGIAIMARNLPKADYTLAENLNVMELLNSEYLILTEDGVKRLEERFAKWAETAKK